MYIPCSTVKRKGKDGRNRKLVEAYRDPETGQPRNRTVRTLETLSILERARLIYQHGGSKHLDPEEWQALEQAGDLAAPTADVQVGDAYAGGGSAVLAGYLRQTGLQVLRPSSKNAYVADRRQTLGYLLGGKREVSADRLYGALDGLADGFEGVRDILNRQHPPKAGRVLLYDLGNSYFCGQKSELGGHGYSNQKRHDRYIVSYGLVLSGDQLPLDIRVWKGGRADNQTVLDTFSQWKQTYQADQAVWVAEPGDER